MTVTATIQIMSDDDGVLKNCDWREISSEEHANEDDTENNLIEDNGLEKVDGDADDFDGRGEHVASCQALLENGLHIPNGAIDKRL